MRTPTTQIMPLMLLGFAAVFAGCHRDPVKKMADGIVVAVGRATTEKQYVRLRWVNDHIIRVTAGPSAGLSRPASLMIRPGAAVLPRWSFARNDRNVEISSAAVHAVVSLRDGHVSFQDSAGRVLVTEKPGGRSFEPETVDSVQAYRIGQIFLSPRGNALYGLGENQLGLTDIRGRDMMLAQHNSEAFVPFLVSSGHYGILWDNNSITYFGAAHPWLPLDSLFLTDTAGNPGALNATYVSGKRAPVVHTREGKIDYEDLDDLHRFPDGFSLSSSAEVDWQGYFLSPADGTHTFRFYAGGYLKVWIDNVLKVDRWRQCWNPAETRVDIPLQKGRKYALRIQWRPDGGESYLAVQWKRPVSESRQNEIALRSEMGRTIDYYLIEGANTDSIISGYRELTGRAPMMPVWAYGFWQSREHYDSAKEILSIASQFRQKHIPIDNIVQDWFYWKKDRWGSQQFDSTRYPDPRGMIDSLHERYHLHFMISVWPKFYEGIPAYQRFWDSGWLYRKNIFDKQKDWVGYVSTFYDAFNPRARRAFWDLVNTRLFSLGVDAWWLDASEPDILSNTSIAEKKALMNPTALGPSTEYYNAYPLANEEAFYTGQRRQRPDQRVFILTRSAFAGSQRYSAATWSGDIGATWQDLKNQIAAGISFSISGIPYWTMDIGGFATESRYQRGDPGSLAEWREQLTRWYQFGAFCPLFRAHGQPPYREPFLVAPKNSAAYASILYYDRLRYRMLPYIYSVAGAVYLHNYTMMRGLVMDFPADSTASRVNDEFLFGPDLLVCPVYTYRAVARQVYLPAGTEWYGLYDGKLYDGGQTIRADAPFSRIPVFARAGTILPWGPALEYTGQRTADTLTLQVYTGKDGRFTLYEDQGLDSTYESGQYALIPCTYRDADHSLTIGQRQGSFKGMLSSRVFRILWIGPSRPAGLDRPRQADQTIHYTGKEIRVTQP